MHTDHVERHHKHFYCCWRHSVYERLQCFTCVLSTLVVIPSNEISLNVFDWLIRPQWSEDDCQGYKPQGVFCSMMFFILESPFPWYTGICWKIVFTKIEHTWIYLKSDFVTYWNMKNILESILEYTGISKNNLLATLPEPSEFQRMYTRFVLFPSI